MRIKIFFTSLTACFIFLFGGLFYLEVLRGPYYKQLAEENRITVVPLEGPRGKIYDRKGVAFIDNRVSFDVSIIYSEIKDKNALISFLSSKLNIDKNKLSEEIQNAKYEPFASHVIAEDVGKDTAIILEQYRLDYPGLLVTTRAKRDYIYGSTASEIIGYLGKISQYELARFKTYGYAMTDLVGRSGLEKKYDTYLKGSSGGMQIETDSLGRQRRLLHVNQPLSGKELHLTIDIDLQEFCDDVMGKRRGCVIAMNPKTGEILALASKPNFDPSLFIKGGKKIEAMRIVSDASGDYPLLNRAISCAYPPGSIFKIVVSTAALQNKIFSKNMSFSCGGYYNLSGKIFNCWKEEGHGIQGIDEAIKNSCNVFFYQLGLKTGPEPISYYAKKFGFGKLTGIDLPGEITGLVPNALWKRTVKKEVWYPGDTVNFSIGQGYLLVTPIQVICMMSAYANGGYLVTPYIVDSIDDVKVSSVRMEDLDISRPTYYLVREGLKRVVNDPYGTGMKAKIEDMVVAGKTGTAQNPEGKSHGWFSGFAPFDDPKICVLVFVEFGGKGGLEASIIARKVIEKARELNLL